MLNTVGGAYAKDVESEERSPMMTVRECPAPSPGGTVTTIMVSVCRNTGRSITESKETAAETKASEEKQVPVIVRFAPSVGTPSASARRRPPSSESEKDISLIDGGAYENVIPLSARDIAPRVEMITGRFCP